MNNTIIYLLIGIAVGYIVRYGIEQNRTRDKKNAN